MYLSSNNKRTMEMMKLKALFFCRPLLLLPLLFGLQQAVVVLLLLCSTPATTAQEEPCTLCVDGTAVPDAFLDAPVFDFEQGQSTCAAFAAGAAAIGDISASEAAHQACRQLQDVGLSNCGCTTPGE